MVIGCDSCSNSCFDAWETDQLWRDAWLKHKAMDDQWCDEANPCNKSLASCLWLFRGCYGYNSSWRVVARNFLWTQDPPNKSRDVSDCDRPARWTPWFLHRPNRPEATSPWPNCHFVLGEVWIFDRLTASNDVPMVFPMYMKLIPDKCPTIKFPWWCLRNRCMVFYSSFSLEIWSRTSRFEATIGQLNATTRGRTV